MITMKQVTFQYPNQKEAQLKDMMLTFLICRRRCCLRRRSMPNPSKWIFSRKNSSDSDESGSTS